MTSCDTSIILDDHDYSYFHFALHVVVLVDEISCFCEGKSPTTSFLMMGV
jgi:hypothetical protein